MDRRRRERAEATLSLDTSPKIPADLTAEVRSVSAVGEQYVDLLPRTDSPPYLQDGSVIAACATPRFPQPVGPMLDQVSTLIEQHSRRTSSARLLDESFKALQRRRLRPRLAVRLVVDDCPATSTASPTRPATLIEDSGPLLDSQAQTTDAITDVGAQPGRGHRAGGRRTIRRCAPCCNRDPMRATRSRDCSTRSSPRCRCCWPTSPHRPGRGDLPRVARAAAGAAAAVSWPVIQSSAPDEQPDRYAAGRLHDHRSTTRRRARSASCRRRSGGHPPTRPSRHPRRPVLQAAAGFADRRARRAQLSLHGGAGKACPDGRRTATATSPTNRWRCGSMRSARTRSIRTWSRRASRRTIGSVWATDSTPRWRERPTPRSASGRGRTVQPGNGRLHGPGRSAVPTVEPRLERPPAVLDRPDAGAELTRAKGISHRLAVTTALA